MFWIVIDIQHQILRLFCFWNFPFDPWAGHDGLLPGTPNSFQYWAASPFRTDDGDDLYGRRWTPGSWKSGEFCWVGAEKALSPILITEAVSMTMVLLLCPHIGNLFRFWAGLKIRPQPPGALQQPGR